ncbi:hypothetical protein [Rhodospirillum sp. A1_3_36]|uniref:hypothetical protein n=1 Tax=Rhodospirillum sp. A1_3_36 TaxID=3391666 RepID=UPI0039A466A4
MIIHPAAQVAFLDTTFDVFDLNGTRWVRGDHIRTTLGIPQTTFKRLIKAHRSEFGAAMMATITAPTPGGAQQVRIFSPRGAARVAMLARTDRAAAFRDWVSDVLEGKAQPPLAHPEEPALPATLDLAARLVRSMALPSPDDLVPLLAPEARRVLRYRRLGLMTSEIVKLTGRRPTYVKDITARLRAIGLLGASHV